MKIRRIVQSLLLSAILLAFVPSVMARGGGHSSGYSASHSGGSGSVHGYTRSNGTYVAPYTRSASGPSGSSVRYPLPSGVSQFKMPTQLPFIHAPSNSGRSSSNSSQIYGMVARDASGKIIRSEEARHLFMKQTGYSNGRPGYIIDHIIPLKRGGADDPSNMQWQTVEEAKAKDKIE